jgi:hypothetical protein
MLHLTCEDVAVVCAGQQYISRTCSCSHQWRASSDRNPADGATILHTTRAEPSRCSATHIGRQGTVQSGFNAKGPTSMQSRRRAPPRDSALVRAQRIKNMQFALGPMFDKQLHVIVSKFVTLTMTVLSPSRFAKLPSEGSCSQHGMG